MSTMSNVLAKGVFRTWSRSSGRTPGRLSGAAGLALGGLRMAMPGGGKRRGHPLSLPAARARRKVYPAWVYGEAYEYRSLMADAFAGKGAPAFDPGDNDAVSVDMIVGAVDWCVEDTAASG